MPTATSPSTISASAEAGEFRPACLVQLPLPASADPQLKRAATLTQEFSDPHQATPTTDEPPLGASPYRRVAANAGMGKTGFIAGLIDSAARRGYRFLSARPSSSELGFSYTD